MGESTASDVGNSALQKRDTKALQISYIKSINQFATKQKMVVPGSLEQIRSALTQYCAQMIIKGVFFLCLLFD